MKKVYLKKKNEQTNEKKANTWKVHEGKKQIIKRTWFKINQNVCTVKISSFT